MYKKYTGKDRRRVAMKKIQLVRKYTAADGTRRVSWSQFPTIVHMIEKSKDQVWSQSDQHIVITL